MYSRKVIDANIDKWQRHGGFTPIYRTVSESEAFVSHINSLVEYDPKTDAYISRRDPKREVYETLMPDEIAWMRNERLLSRLDFMYWVTHYVRIKGVDDRECRLDPWNSQKIFMQIVGEMEELQIAILLLVLKARQLGLSRISTLISAHRAWFTPNRNAFMASSTEQKTGLLYDMVDFVWDRLPWWMQPGKKFERSFKFVEYHNGSAITLQHGQQTTGIARGTTPTVFHLSELAEFDEGNVANLVDSSLLVAVHDTPETFGVLEGTAEGQNNWWHKKWGSSKSGWPVHRSRLRPIFLPHFVGGLEPTPDWLRAHPVPSDYSNRMMPWAYAHAQMAEEYVKQTAYLSKFLGSNWTMPIELIWWYECERDAAIRENRLNKFLQERPANDDEAFQSTQISVFDTETIVFYRDNAHKQPLFGVYGLRGPYIPARFVPSDLSIDYEGIDSGEKPIMPIECKLPDGSALQYELVPLRFEGWSLEDDGGSIDKIFIWERPLPGFKYGFGVDTADGIDKDRTVIEIVRIASIYGPNKQVGEYASGKMNAIDCWPWLLALGTWYSVADEQGVKRQPRMCIECAGKGDIPQNIIRMIGWTNFHQWVDNQIDRKKIELHKATKLGIFTRAGWFRDGMIDFLVKTLRDCDIEICSPHFVREMQSLQGDEMIQSLRAGYGGHDDRIMAVGFVLVSMLKFNPSYFLSEKIAAYSGKSPLKGIMQAKQYPRWAYGNQERSDAGEHRAFIEVDYQKPEF